MNSISGMCLDVGGSSLDNGGLIKQAACLGSTKLNQLWKLNVLSSGVYSLISVNSNKCLDVPSKSLSNGIQLHQWTCNGGANQAWKATVIPAPTPSPTPTLGSWGQSSAKLSITDSYRLSLYLS